MKRTYQKPNLKSVKLISESALLQASLNMGGTIDGGVNQALSNEEGKHDIWGNSSNGIW